ncbi:hypothetical protein C8R45DRAFT_1106883 [Mycena sanguinolenta]|nr:hypothetical protein C8R45DRAFT_1106883 [Mycena sanguinolenta]
MAKNAEKGCKNPPLDSSTTTIPPNATSSSKCPQPRAAPMPDKLSPRLLILLHLHARNSFVKMRLKWLEPVHQLHGGWPLWTTDLTTTPKPLHILHPSGPLEI